MASLCRRDDHELLQPALARRAKLSRRRSGSGGRGSLSFEVTPGKRSAGLGNFWSDLIRAVLWVLLPVSLLGSLFLIAQGVPMNFLPYTIAHTIEGGTQTIAQGPVAALELIKNLGTNGGGFFNVNGCASIRESDAINEFPRTARDCRHSGCVHTYFSGAWWADHATVG